MKKHKAIVEILKIAAVVTAAFLISFFNIFSSFDTSLSDKFYGKTRGINNKIKIIGIDEKTLNDLGQMGTWSRQVYADLINTLGDYPAEVIFDLMIFSDMDKEGDDAFRDACRNTTVPIISGSYINFKTVYKYSDKGIVYMDNLNADSVDMPIIKDMCETGFVNAFPDDDGITRSVKINYNYNGEVIESLSYKAYRKYCEVCGIPENTPVLENGMMNLSYAGSPQNYEEISLSSVLSGEVNPKVFSGCVVFVGAYASGLMDQYAVPNSSLIMFGTEIHANTFQALLDGRFPVHADRTVISLICAAVVGILFFLFRRTELKISIPASILVGAVYIITAAVLFGKGIMIPILYFPLFDVLVVVLSIIKHYLTEYNEKKKISEVFRKYVAPQVVDEITEKGGYTLKLGGESREVAVLFVDIRGFTPMSESLEPEQVVDILNSYLELTTKSIFNNGGTLDKFIGDATMAVFNAPFDLDDYIFRACKTALDIVAGGDAIESRFLEKYGRSVGFGVGVNCGRAVVGNIGCSFRMDYTAIGDTVNTAARLEANAKRGQVLISEEVYNHVKDRITAEPVGAIPLKGKSNSVFVYSLTGVVSAEDQNP